MSTSAQLAVQNRYARCPIASPSAKYSNNASSVTNPTANATIAVDPHNTVPTTNGISTAAVATRFQVIKKDSPVKSRPLSHHIGTNKSRKRAGQTLSACPLGGNSSLRGKESQNFSHYSLSLICLEEKLCMRGALEDDQLFRLRCRLKLRANSSEPQPIRAGVI